MTDQVLRDALRMMARELVVWREMQKPDDSLIDEAVVDSAVAEFLDKARGFEGSEGAP